MQIVFSLLLALVAYLIGSISFAVVVSKFYGLADPRTYGSKNPGATNVLRTGSKKAAILTLLGDAAKGWVAVFPVQLFGADFGFGTETVGMAALAVFLGHLWPVFTRFEGGKGVATSLGVLVGLSPWLGLAALATWLTVAFIFRYSSLSALLAAGFSPLFAILLFGLDERFFAVLVMCALLIMRHQDNIRRLVRGEEGKIGSKKDKPGEPASAE